MCEGPQLRAEVLNGPSDLQPGPQRLAALRLLAGHDSIVSLGGLVGSLRPSHRIFCTTWLREGGAGGGETWVQDMSRCEIHNTCQKAYLLTDVCNVCESYTYMYPVHVAYHYIANSSRDDKLSERVKKSRKKTGPSWGLNPGPSEY